MLNHHQNIILDGYTGMNYMNRIYQTQIPPKVYHDEL